jgi:uncharacterized damage-inducible protein DinB
MTSREHFLMAIKADGPAFGKVLAALPADKLDYTPHPKSRTAHSLAAQLGFTPNMIVDVINTGKINFNPAAEYPPLDQIQAAGKAGHEALVTRLESLDDNTWENKKAQMVAPDGKVVWEDTIGNMSWGFLFDAIHHRGQLSAYIRPMGGKVPSIYGPSADDPGNM